MEVIGWVGVHGCVGGCMDWCVHARARARVHKHDKNGAKDAKQGRVCVCMGGWVRACPCACACEVGGVTCEYVHAYARTHVM